MALYEKVLAQWPVPSEHLRVPTRHGETQCCSGCCRKLERQFIAMPATR